MQQDDVRHVLCRVHGGIHRDANIGLADCRNIVRAVAQKAHGVAVFLQRLHDPHLLARAQLGKDSGFFRGAAQLQVGQGVQLCAGEQAVCVDADPLADRAGDLLMVAGQDFGLDLQCSQPGNGLGRGALGRVKERQIAHQDHVPLVVCGDMALAVQVFPGYSHHLHAVLQHLGHHRVQAGSAVPGNGADSALVLHKGTAGKNRLHIALHDQGMPAAAGQEDAGVLPVIVKGNLIHLLVLPGQGGAGVPFSRHGPAFQNRGVDGVPDAGVVQAVEVGEAEHRLALITQEIHVIVQEDARIGQGTGFIGAQNVHRAKVLYRVEVLDDHFLF